MTSLTIAGRAIGADQPPYIIAEMSANHLHDINRAMTLLKVAADAGADAVKIQHYTADTITLDVDRPEFQITGGPWAGQSLHQLYQDASMPWEWTEALFAEARRLGITLFSSPFDFTAIDLLERMDAPAYKIASFEAVDLPLIRRAAQTGKPLIMSTGMAGLGEIAKAVETVRAVEGTGDLCLLHCVSGYPAPVEDSNLRTIPHLRDAFGVVTGLSDHTLGTAVSVAATVLGAAVIEKHYCLSRDDGGPDAAFSLEPDELAALVRDTRAAWQALGRVDYDLKGSERGNVLFRRSLYITRDMRAGDELSPDNLRSVRPGHGLAPRHYDALLGRRLRRDAPRGTPMSWDLVE